MNIVRQLPWTVVVEAATAIIPPASACPLASSLGPFALRGARARHGDRAVEWALMKTQTQRARFRPRP